MRLRVSGPGRVRARARLDSGASQADNQHDAAPPSEALSPAEEAPMSNENGQQLKPTALATGRNVFFVILGVVGLVLKGHYSGRWQVVIHSYGGNVAASFATYFVVSNLRPPFHWRYGRLLTAAGALLVVELFEVTNGFGVMSNVYDPMDLVANAGGVALALAVDALTPARLLRHRS
jgi:hypothetical protein